MPTSKRPAPVEPKDLFAHFDSVPNTFGNVQARETTRILPGFKQEDHVEGATPYDDPRALKKADAASQSGLEQVGYAAKQFGAGVASGIGQSLANLLDVSAYGNDNYDSSLFGVKASEMQGWANKVNSNNKILQQNEGAFDLGDSGWWANQVGQSGMGVGMGIAALAETAAIELGTGGGGTGVALSRLGKFISNLNKAGKADVVAEGINITRGLKSSATVFGAMNRLSESRTEAMNTYKDIERELSLEKNPDGTAKYTAEQVKEYASAGADRTYQWNLALMPLDILGYRMMVFNPISGAAEGFIEKGLEKIGNKLVRKAVAGTTFGALEGLEEGEQFVGEQEGKHYARVLAGLEDSGDFVGRVKNNVRSDEFWNSFAGGVIGSPIIGGAMKVLNKTLSGNRQGYIDSVHKDYIQNVGKMDNYFASELKKAEENGNTRKADNIRRQSGQRNALKGLHLDAMTDSSAGYNGYLTFLEGTLAELNAGKTNALEDMGISEPTEDQIEKIKMDFGVYIQDAKDMKNVYDQVKNRYPSSFVPEIAQEHFYLNQHINDLGNVDATIQSEQNTLNQYGSLSAQGKEIYNSEYQLQALQAESDRLHLLHKEFSNPYEVENAKKLIDENQKQMSAVKQRLTELNTDEAYTAQQKNNDTEIIESSIKSANYGRAVYDKVRLNNEISLRRKNLANWNKEEYRKARSVEAIAKAKTVEQVDDLKATMPEATEAAEEKKAQIVSQQTADAIQAEHNEQLGDSNLFEEDENHGNIDNYVIGDSDLFEGAMGDLDKINAMFGSPEQQNTLKESAESRAAETLMAPATIDPAKFTGDQQVKVKQAVGNMLAQMKPEGTFEELVRSVIERKGKEFADKNYNLLASGWNLNGKPKTDFTKAYNVLFTNPFDALEEVGNSVFMDEQNREVAESNDQVAEAVIADKVTPVFDADNQAVKIIHNGPVTSNTKPKFAKLIRLSEQHLTPEEEGIVSTYDFTSEELNEGQYVNSLPLLDPNGYTPDTEMSVRIPPNFNDLLIPIYNADGTKGTAVTFGKYVAQKGLKPTDQEYKDKIPMIIYDKGVSAEAKGRAFVHDAGWYHENRFRAENAQQMQEAIAATRKVREAVLASNGAGTSITITENRPTTFDPFKTKSTVVNGETVYEWIPLKEANPEAKILIALNAEQLTENNKDAVLEDDHNTVIKRLDLVPGFMYDIRRVGMKGAKKAWAAFHVSPQPLTTEAKTTIRKALTIYANRLNPNPQVRASDDATVKKFQEITGFNLKDQKDIQQYLRMFVNYPWVVGAENNLQAEAQIRQLSQRQLEKGGKKAKPITGYFTFIKGGNILIGVNGITAYEKGGVKQQSFFINPNSTNPNLTGIGHLSKKVVPTKTTEKISILDSFTQNYDILAAQGNKPIAMISDSGEVTQVAASYKDYVVGTLNTNIRSVNVGTKEKPVWATSDNMISYQLSSEIKESGANEIVPAQAPLVEVNTQEDGAAEILRQIREQAERDGINVDEFGDGELLSPAALTDMDRREITLNLDRIRGLNDKEEQELVDYFTNQIFDQVPLIENAVPKPELIASVKATYQKDIAPRVEDYKSRIAAIDAAIAANPSIKDQLQKTRAAYQKALTKVESVGKSIDQIIAKAYKEVTLNTGVKTSVVKTQEAEDNDDNPEGQEGGDQRVDFWTEVLTLNPDNKVSFALRRFLRNIPKRNKAGEVVRGVFGLPTYEDSGALIQTLMPMLADVQADFGTMMAAMNEKIKGYTWVAPLVAKLQGADNQTKKQFVTVMANAPLRLKFTMITQNKKDKTWTTAVWDTNEGGIIDSIIKDWENNFVNTPIVSSTVDEDGDSIMDKEKAQELINTYKGWIGTSAKVVESDLGMFIPSLNRVRKDAGMTITPTGKLATELATNLVKNSDRMKFQVGTTFYQISKGTDGKYLVEFLKQDATKAEIKRWLAAFGIELTPGGFDELTEKGLYHNYETLRPTDLFNEKKGLFGILANSLQGYVDKDVHVFEDRRSTPLNNTIVKSLAKLDSKYDTTHVAYGGRDNGKSFFAITANKFITDRTRDLKSPEGKVRNQLGRISFSKSSAWLTLLQDADYRNKFSVSHEGFNAMQILGKKSKKDNAITKLSGLDYEVSKNGKFWDMSQGEILYKNPDGSTTKNYPGTTIPMRWATMYAPTMSDKHIAITFKTMVLNLSNKHLNNGKNISEEVSHLLYTQTVKPELERMINFFAHVKKSNIKKYDEGAAMFLMLPQMNALTMPNGGKLINFIKNNPESATLAALEGNKEFMDQVHSIIGGVVNSLKEEKLKVWKDNGLTVYDDNGKVKNTQFIDNQYLHGSGKFYGTLDEKINMAALDLIVNEQISISNAYMLYAGDPALFYKKDSRTKPDDHVQIAKDTFTNMGKRLANQIAPGTTLADSVNDQYLQLFIEDRNSIADKDFIKFSSLINDGHQITDEDYDFIKSFVWKEKTTQPERDRFDALKERYPKTSGFFEIEASNAQEYTTWKEHLDIMEKLGKTPDVIQDVTIEEIREARKLFTAGTPVNKLSDKQLKLIGKVMQPIKPVFTGQVYDEAQDVMRTVYIKTSSFPLIPQLTAGLQIDKLREKMESLQTSRKMNVRASYQSGNKVGAMNTAPRIWDENGDADMKGIGQLGQAALVLDRSNFRIQQEVPYKSDKVKEDKITLGTQLMKMLFGNDIINHTFMYDGVEMSGVALEKLFTDSHIELIDNKRQELFEDLGLDKYGKPVDYEKSLIKIQDLLKLEAEERDFPIQTIEGLTLQYDRDSSGKVVKAGFVLPLWSSVNSNKFESLLNAIIVNRMVKIKFPGTSAVVGSEEGFKVKAVLEGEASGVNQSNIVYTSKWTGSLQGTYFADGSIKTAQILMPSKFRDKTGKLIDMLDPKYSKDGKLNEDMFDMDLLKMTSFRLPTTGISSASQIEIVGFLPAENGDLMIVPKTFVQIKGLDFDVDKENAYKYWTHETEDGKIVKLTEKHRAELLAQIDPLLKDANDDFLSNKGNAAANKAFADFAGGDYEDYTLDEINAVDKMRKLSRDIDNKILQNKIIAVYQAVLGSTDPKVQAKINGVLNTNFSEEEALFVEKLEVTNSANFTPLSGEYQKMKLKLGADGKIGTGAYALDVTFHSQVQQALAKGRPISLTQQVGEGENAELVPKTFRFGNIESDGILGKSVTIDGSRSTSDLLNETVQIAVDNEKLQVMGRLNLNGLTLDVHKVFNLLGIDKFSKDGHSVAYLFMSQPIIREYVENLNNANSNLASLVKFESGKKQKTIDKLIAKYWNDYYDNTEEDLEEVFSNLMNQDNMIASIQSADPVKEFGKMQVGALLRFIEMEKYGLAIRNIQTSLNVDSKGLDKSFFDVIQKRNKLDSLGQNNLQIANVDTLVGDYIEIPATQEGINAKLDEGYHQLKNTMVKPSTIVGAFSVKAVATAYDMWKDYLPYDSKVVSALFDEILPQIENLNTGDTRGIENRQDIFGELKKYLSTMKKSGFIGMEDDITAERKSLYIDSDENTSLAKYLYELGKITDNSVVTNHIKSNKLFQRFSFDINKNGKPSLIKYNNTQGEGFNETTLYNAFTSWFEAGNLELPQIGNKKYNVDTLAQALIEYSFIGNAKQEAIQFTKYAPVSYLNRKLVLPDGTSIGYSYNMRVINDRFAYDKDFLQILDRTDETMHQLSPFSVQFIQHNPEMVKNKVDAKEFPNKFDKLKDGTFFMKDVDAPHPTFVTVYDPKIKSKKKFRLYQFNGEVYSAIPVLGIFGMDEYSFGQSAGESIVNGVVKLKGNPTNQKAHTQNVNKEDTKPAIGLFKLPSENLTEVMTAISESATHVAPVAKAMLGKLGNTTIKVSDVTSDGKQSFDGAYNWKTNTIVIHPNVIENADLLAETVVHEVTHALTYHELEPHIWEEDNPYSVTVRDGAPSYVSDLVRVYNTVRRAIDSEQLAKGLKVVTTAMEAEKPIQQEMRDKFYGFTSIHEFMTMALSNKTFQDYLNTIPYAKTGQSLLDRFKEIISKILGKLGLEFDEGYSLVHAVDAIFAVVNSPKPATNIFDDMYEDAINANDEYIPSEDENSQGFNPENFMDDPNGQGELLSATISDNVKDYINSLSSTQKIC